MDFEIEQFLFDGDPVVNGKQDWRPALMRAQTQWLGTIDPNQLYYRYKGFSLRFGPREYYFSDSIQLIRGMSLIGSGGAGSLAGSVLRFDVGHHVIICNDLQTAPSDTLGRATASIIERLRIEGEYDPNDRRISHGILAKTKITVRDCAIDGFSGDGIHIDASTYGQITPRSFQSLMGGTSGDVEPSTLEDPNTPTPVVNDNPPLQWRYLGEFQQWQANTSYSVNNIVIPTTYNRTGYLYICTQAGISGISEPQPNTHPWPTKIGEFVDDGTSSPPLRWKCLGKDESWKSRYHYATNDTIMTGKPSEASDWQIQNCIVQNCENGLYINGSDANVGCAIELYAGSNRGWGIFDYSTEGNTYVACHTEFNKQGPYYIRGHAQTCLINCYSESKAL